jgi:hypothetical protein
MKVFAFRVRRGGEEFEYDAIVPWNGHLFLFECKNRSLSGNDPVQTYYFDREVASQVKQVQRLAKALDAYPDIIEDQMGPEYSGMTIVPCVLHSLPYSRGEDIDGVYFTDSSLLRRFLNEPVLRIKAPHRIGRATILHRIVVRQLWKGDKPSAEDFLEQLRRPAQLELSMKHLGRTRLRFSLSETKMGETIELVRTEMTVRSVSDAAGADADKVVEEIAAISGKVEELRSELKKRTGGEPPPRIS